MYILIVTSSKGDVHVASVLDYIKDGFIPLIIDTEDFGINWFVSLFYEGIEESYITVDTKKVSVNDIYSVWWRKPTPVNVKYMKDELASFVFRETNDTIYGLIWILETLGKKVINHPFYNYKASIKPLQLLIARKIGLLCPETTITNSSESAKQMIEDSDCISKGVSMSWAIEDNKNYSIYVKQIDSEKLEKISLIEKCPATIQELIHKDYDVRIVVIFDKAFCFKIENSDKNIDWAALMSIFANIGLPLLT
ncbi:MvdC/MvdD family ATP grasp protein [Methylovulum psychrotolerans]|uniref:MvdD-like pre-ATP grasp domain-containing protein n=1 Tax=Methylovulum psychrotolerans TaxID=1704499 RepID=A0A1Z4C2U8_9GAMM|nr:hypothetical protein [Methylovulum psychrotolerans]ASF47844.1 hypothetical protein CEK71_18205 [Methylovulum psychrotolerans]